MAADDVREQPCPQAWHGGLRSGLLVECRFQAKHRGLHRNEASDLQWSGKLTAQEMSIAAAMRERPDELAARR